MLMKFINIPVFILSLAIGIFLVYIFVPEERKIYVYPTPENVDKVQYKDKTGTCFTLKQEQTECPSDSSLISKVPMQH